MLGSPLFRAVIAFVSLAVLGLPVWRLTHTRASAPQAEVAPVAKPVHIAIAFTVAPRGVKVRHLAKEIWADASASGEIERDLTLPWPKEGVDLQIQIDWPADAPLAAARVRVTDPDGREHEKSIFSKGPADEVLTFP